MSDAQKDLAAGRDLAAEIAVAWPGTSTWTMRDGKLAVRIDADQVVPFVEWAMQAGFTRYVDCSVVDDPNHSERYDVNWVLYSLERRCWLRIKSRTNDSMPSLVPQFGAANWYEREAFDLFGVLFEGHPNLVRILLPDDADFHPLRRDHPLGGEPIDFTVTREQPGRRNQP